MTETKEVHVPPGWGEMRYANLVGKKKRHPVYAKGKSIDYAIGNESRERKKKKGTYSQSADVFLSISIIHDLGLVWLALIRVYYTRPPPVCPKSQTFRISAISTLRWEPIENRLEAPLSRAVFRWFGDQIERL
jgi:hypothetical protein